ncbi:hypothetical protein DMN91_012181 [Ooceraea biroi]|uniref:Coiled-coil domain-containing protein n=1 Tax=Ooceraea biroi TaxID=2015173 RepID=A0A3L8D3U2_OOCBI|nr:coiled-coil domain-containing protein 186 isoform X1 [Ooceraea biroi]XP_011349475.2 coiled-coil domain-containing protein 186 isoform X1 [Ooceraea biroi]RLU15187.1 hypothetical protein DMN91_012181 [Ooceraea biroi]
MGEKPDFLGDGTNLTEKCDDDNKIIEQDVQLITDTGIIVPNDHHESKVCSDNSDLTLLRKDNGKSDLMDSINLDIENSITNVPNTNLQTCQQLFSSENCLSQNSGYLRKSFTHSVSLPTIATSSADTSLVGSIANRSKNDTQTQINLKTACTDEEETLFNQSCDVKKQSESLRNRKITEACRNNSLDKHNELESIDSQLQTVDNTSSSVKNQSEGDPSKESGSNALMPSKHARNNPIPRTVLADDSKLVKMSLLTNPMNIMQSNAQLINKSRNFLNFITEKSTNIMEKALLPQHLAMRYNHASRSIETDARLYANNESAARGITPRSNINVTTSNDILSAKGCSIKRTCGDNKDELDNVVNNENEIKTNEIVCTDFPPNEEQSMHNNDLENDEVSKERKYIPETSNIGVIAAQARCDVSLTETNEDKYTCLQTEKLHDDKYKEDSEEKLNRSDKSFHEIQTTRDALTLQVENLERTVNKLSADLNASLNTQQTLRKECLAANKEKDNMVMKYVISEKQLIDSQRAKECAERKVKEVLKDQESLQNKLRQTQGERTRICVILDGKCREITELQKEMETVKEDVKIKEIKLKWSQNKLKTEMDSQKDTQQKLDKALMKINDMKEECEQIRRETQESFRKFQQSEENKAVTLDQQLKEHQARLILERHVTEDKETLRLQLQRELEMLKSRQQSLIEENKSLNVRVQESEQARLSNEDNLNKLRIAVNQREEQIAELLSKVSQLETMKLQLQHKDECMAAVEAELAQLRSANEELRSDMQACRQKEADMLDFTQKLTHKNVCLQSEFTAIETKANHLESEHGPLRDCIGELTSKVKALEEDLAQERRKRREECEILARHVAEQTQLAQNFAQKLEDSQGENAILKRKHQVSIKEMAQELQQCRRKLEMLEAASPNNSLDIASRTGSNTSLNTGDALNGALSDNNSNGDHIHSVEPSKQVLIDRIIKLQKINVKRAEKLDFLEEHTQTLVEELQKKTKIIQNYVLHQNFGALTCNERDRHKHIKSKRDSAELARHGGIMASVYNHRVSDENMTLELSLEINQKLQAVLEDALLKNITLKDNIDTLGNEIAKLTMQHQQKQIEN